MGSDYFLSFTIYSSFEMLLVKNRSYVEVGRDLNGRRLRETAMMLSGALF